LHNKQNEDIKLDIVKYLKHKCSSQRYKNNRYKIQLDYDSDYLQSLGSTCTYCGIECKFGYEKESNHPDTLSFDKKNPDIGYRKDNIVVSCWFCNRMKNKSIFTEWTTFINFIKKSEITTLDLSTYTYALKSKYISLSNIVNNMRTGSPSYYKTINDAVTVLTNKSMKQNFVDPYFHFFPIIYLKNSLFNASVDAIDSSLIKAEKHKPDNIQVLPCFFNYGKNNLSGDAFVEQWKRRGFKTDFSNCTIIYPDDYHTKSYFNKLIYS
jgi:hypothetical protein